MRMNEQSQEQDNRENLSGYDLAEAWYHEQSMHAETLCDLGDDQNKQRGDEDGKI